LSEPVGSLEGDHRTERVADQHPSVRIDQAGDLLKRIGADLLIGEVAGDLGQRPVDEPLRQTHAEGRKPAHTGQRGGGRPQRRTGALDLGPAGVVQAGQLEGGFVA
jgi:hypothetical protein